MSLLRARRAASLELRSATLRGVAVGRGTVLDVACARQAVDAGAGYLVMPAEVIEEGRRLGVPFLPGAFTPTEILQAWQQGAAMAKVLPQGRSPRRMCCA
ncbi:hypothetical protein AB0K16_53740 [Nonomuraea jabiensis]|uniref:hypothetical protein n=1 Tax=Nonomuraea jabiensis TaxID=882448 RepID=UPI0034441EB1